MVSLPFSTWGFWEITGASDSSILHWEREVFGGTHAFLNGVFGGVPSHPLFSSVAHKQLSHNLFAHIQGNNALIHTVPMKVSIGLQAKMIYFLNCV